jgi:hypothetical protein
VKLTLRYLIDVRQARMTQSMLTRIALERFAAEPDIRFASAFAQPKHPSS